MLQNNANEYWPKWSPNGKELVFQSELDGNIDIYRLILETDSLIRLTNNPAEDHEPSWSPFRR